MVTQDNRARSNDDTQKTALNKRLEDIAWGLFLIMIGCIWLVPDEQIPPGTWLIGAGLIMLGLNGARYLNGIKASSFTMVLGVVAAAAGLASLAGAKLPLLAVFLILIGVSVILKPLFEKRSSDG